MRVYDDHVAVASFAVLNAVSVNLYGCLRPLAPGVAIERASLELHIVFSAYPSSGISRTPF